MQSYRQRGVQEDGSRCYRQDQIIISKQNIAARGQDTSEAEEDIVIGGDHCREIAESHEHSRRNVEKNKSSGGEIAFRVREISQLAQRTGKQFWVNQVKPIKYHR